MKGLACFAWLAAALAATPGGSQSPDAAQQRQPPTFRVAVEYVEIDAVVTDGDGRLVRGLSKEDFDLREGGQAQAITAFTFVDVPLEAADPPLHRASPVEPDTRSNDGIFNGRVFLLVLDDTLTDFRRSARVKAAARIFVERHLGANDLAAVIHTGNSASASQNFTNSRALLLSAIDRFAGRKIQSATAATLDRYNMQRSAGRTPQATDPLAIERAAQSRVTLDRLRAAAEALGNIRGRRKALLWFSEGIDANIDDPRDTFGTIVRDTMVGTIGAAQRAGVSFYAIDPRGVGAGLDDLIEIGALPEDPTLGLGPASLLEDVRRAQMTMRTVSADTGGFAIIGGSDLNREFRKVVQDNSSYYLLGYYPTNDKRDGKYRTVEVRVKRPGLTVRHRKGYAAARSNSPRSSATARAVPEELRDAIESPLPVGGLPMRVFAAPFAGPAKKSSVAVVIEVSPQGLKFVPDGPSFAETLEIIMLPVNADGKLLDGTRDQAPMKLSKRSYDLVRSFGFRAARRIDLAPGRYQLRIAARSTNANAVGAVTYDLDVPDFSRQPLSMSGLALMSSLADRIPTAPPGKEFSEILPGIATALRDFVPEDTLHLFTEIYVSRASSPHAVEIRTTVISDLGVAAFTASDRRRTDEIRASSGGFGHTAKIPLAGLPPGRYVLRVEARALTSDAQTAARELEFRVR